ncbi:MAG: ArsA-related P-loop ATPase [Armatimonadota bacterium]
MKIAIGGKGGVGKSTISAGISLWLSSQGRDVWAVDADPNTTLGYALGWSEDVVDAIQPLSAMRDMLADRATGGGNRSVFALSPPVADIIENYSVRHNGITLMTMGTVTEGGTGCMCPENATLKTILRELVDEDADIVVDMVAGLEHLGRGTAGAMNGLVVVTDPTAPGMRSVRRMHKLAEDLRLDPVVVIANRVRDSADLKKVEQGVAPLPVVGTISYHDRLQAEGVFDGPAGEKFRAEIGDIVEALEADLVAEKK